MSVILEDSQRFRDIHTALSSRMDKISYALGQMSLEGFVTSLHLANVKAYNERYEKEDVKPWEIELGCSEQGLRWSDIELIKALMSIRYNSDEADYIEPFKGTLKLLKDVIYSLMAYVITNLPEYDQAETW